MSNEATTWAWRQTVESPVRKLVLLHMADSASREAGYLSWYSLAKIAERCCCSKSTASANIRWLVDAGYLTLVRPGTRGGGTNCFRVNVGRVEVQDGPGQGVPAAEHPIPAAEHPIPGAEHLPIPAAEPSIPAAEPSIPGAGPRTVKKHKETRERKGRAQKTRASPSPDDEQFVIDTYHEMLPDLPRVSSVGWATSETRENLRKRWADDEHCRNRAFWRPFFAAVRRCKFWMTGDEGSPIEQARLAWLLSPSKYKRVKTLALEASEVAA